MTQRRSLGYVVAATGVVALVAAFDPGYPISTGLSPLTSISCFGLNLANWTTEDTNSDMDGCLFAFIAFGLYFSVAYPVLATLKGRFIKEYLSKRVDDPEQAEQFYQIIDSALRKGALLEAPNDPNRKEDKVSFLTFWKRLVQEARLLAVQKHTKKNQPKTPTR